MWIDSCCAFLQGTCPQQCSYPTTKVQQQLLCEEDLGTARKHSPLQHVLMSPAVRQLTTKSNPLNTKLLSKHHLWCLSRICLPGEFQTGEQSVMLTCCPQPRDQTHPQQHCPLHSLQPFHSASLQKPHMLNSPGQNLSGHYHSSGCPIHKN